MRARSLFDMRLPGHPDYPGPPRAEQRCAACGRGVHARDAIEIAGVALHLECAVSRRRAAKR
jgi:hypothetical protein